jgi:hypothetical protein
VSNDPPAGRGTPPDPRTPTESTAPVRIPPVPTRPEPHRPPAAEPLRVPESSAPAGEPPRSEPPPAAEHRPPTDLDEFLARAVDRQIAEQRALREALQELTGAVRELQARPAAGAPVDPAEIEARVARAVASARPPIDPAELEGRIARAVASAPAVDPVEIEARVSRALAANTEILVNELRDLRSTVIPGVQRVSEASASGSRAIEHDMAILRDAVGGLSADVEGIAQALIDLNAGLRDWADGIDRNIDIVVETVQQARDAAAKAEQLQTEAIESAVEAVEERRAESRPLLPVEGEVVDVDPTGVVPAPVVVAPPPVPSEIEQRVKETIELSLYLADQIESFDKAIASLGDLPSRLEGVLSQALKRTLAARAKLDRDAEMALDEAVATLDEHVATIGDLGSIAAAQRRVEAGLAALAEAVDRSTDGALPRAGSSLARASSAARTPARKAAKSSARTASGARGADKKDKKTKKKASSKPKAAKRTVPRRKRKPAADYLRLDADPKLPDGD